jgi:hypothetical protein
MTWRRRDARKGQDRPRRATRRLALAAVLAALALSGCHFKAEDVRSYTYPPDFAYIERDALQSAMWRLAYHSRELDRVLRTPGALDEARRSEAIGHLDGMLAATDELRTNGRPTNHPLIGTHLETFRRDVVQARSALAGEPPQTFLAGAVSGACLVCHGGG